MSDSPGDLERLAAYAAALADGVERALAPWVETCVERIMTAWAGSCPNDVREAASDAGRRARDEIGPQVRALLALDIDEQRTSPLALVRRAVVYPTDVLRSEGVLGVVRDRQAEQHFPDDVYDLTPGSFADLDPSLQEPSLSWGAAKAHVHLRRHRPDR